MFARPKCLINAECRVDRMGTDQDLLALPHDGQRHELAQFVTACLANSEMPIPLESLLATTKATIAVGESLSSGCREFV